MRDGAVEQRADEREKDAQHEARVREAEAKGQDARADLRESAASR
jgi:hypothetical protein